MGRELEHIRRELDLFSSTRGPVAIVSAEVSQIHANDTVSVKLASGLEIDDCRLKSVVKEGSKIILEPKIGSTVLVGSIAGSYDYAVLAVEEINRMYIKIDGLEFEVKDKLLLKKGTDTLEKLISEMIDEINKIVVMVGTSPNVAALSAIKVRFQQLLA